MSAVILSNSGNLLKIATSDNTPFPEHVLYELKKELTYTYKKANFGNRIDPDTGRKLPKMEFETRTLCRVDPSGYLCTGSGFTTRVTNKLKQLGYTVQLQEKPLTHDRYEWDFNLVLDSFSFRPGQEEALLAFASYQGGVIHAPTAVGKGTLIVMHALLFRKAKIDIVVPGKGLLHQTIGNLSSKFGPIGQIGAGKVVDERVTVISADSLHLSEAEADFLIFDEVHKAAAPSYLRELRRYKNSRNFGLSATPQGRFDGADLEIECVFGPTIYQLSDKEAVEKGLIAPIRVEWLDVKMKHNPCGTAKHDTTREARGIWRNQVRNKIIADKARTYDSDTQVLISVRTVEHAVMLGKELPEYTLCYSTINTKDLEAYREAGLLGPDEGEPDTKIVEQQRKDFASGKLKKIIAVTGNSGWGTGGDFPQLEVLIRADAIASSIGNIQIPGRTRRLSDGKDYATVVDLFDLFDSKFKARSIVRKRHYDKAGWEQINVHWN